MNKENKWFRVVEDDGWFWVEHKNVPPGDVAGGAILPVTTRGVILQSHRRRSQAGAETFEIPRGLRDEGETAAACALRELHEETGLLVAADDLHPLGYLRPDTGLLAARVALFWADVKDTPLGVGDGEALKNFEITRAALRDWLVQDRIEDAFALAAILRLTIAKPDWLAD